MMVMMVMVPRTHHPHAAVPVIAMLHVPPPIVMVVMVMVVIDRTTWIILRLIQFSRRILTVGIVGIEAAHCI